MGVAEGSLVVPADSAVSRGGNRQYERLCSRLHRRYTKPREVLRTCTIGIASAGILLCIAQASLSEAPSWRPSGAGIFGPFYESFAAISGTPHTLAGLPISPAGSAHAAAWNPRPGEPATTGQLEYTYVTSTLWSRLGDMKVRGSLAYVAFRNGLTIFDVSDSANPTVLNRLYLQHGIASLDVQSYYVYITSRTDEFQILDVSNPIDPTVVSTTTVGAYNSMDVEGEFAYVANSAGTLLQVLDVSDILNPVLRGQATVSGPRELRAKGDHVYLLESNKGLKVVDVSDPDNPIVTGTYSCNAYVSGLAVEGDYLYFGTEDSVQGTYMIFDISDPDSPCQVTSLQLGVRRSPSSSDVLNGFAFLAIGGGGLRVIDVRDPLNPVIVASLLTPAPTSRVVAAGRYVYVLDEVFGSSEIYNGLEIVSVRDVLNPVTTGSYYVPGYCSDVWVDGRYAYVSLSGDGMRIVDISDICNPMLLGRFPANTHQVIVSDSFAYLADQSNEVKILDVSNPLAPIQAASIPTLFSATRIDVESPFIYYVLNGAPNVLGIGDITNPFSPTKRGSLCVTGSVEDIDVEGSYAYLACGPEGVEIIDVSDPDNPYSVGTFDGLIAALAIGIDYPYAFLASYHMLQILDLTDPTDPTLLAERPVSGHAWDVHVSNNRAYIGGFEVYDVSDPSSPILIGAYDTPYNAKAIHKRGDYVFVADGASLMILRETSVGVHEETHDPSAGAHPVALGYPKPNPFSNSSTVSYFLRRPADVSLCIYDSAGRLVRSLVDGWRDAGNHEVSWQGRNDEAQLVPAGVYFCRLQAGDFTDMKKIVVLR